jgi:hypothetical protein
MGALVTPSNHSVSESNSKEWRSDEKSMKRAGAFEKRSALLQENSDQMGPDSFELSRPEGANGQRSSEQT